MISVFGYAAIIHGIVNALRAGVDAYMVGVAGAQPRDVIFLDDLTSPLSESLPFLVYGIAVTGVGLWLIVFARNRRRRIVMSIGEKS